MLEKIINEAKKHFSSCEATTFKRVSTPVGFESGRLKEIQQNERSGFALRAIKDGKMTFAATTKPDDVEDLVAQALESAPYAPEAIVEFAASGGSFEKPAITNDNTRNLTTEKMIEMGKEAVDFLKPLHEKALVGAGVKKTLHKVEIATSKGFQASYERDEFSFYAGLDLTTGENFLQVGEGWGSVQIIPSTKQLLEIVKDQFTWGLKNVPIKTGKYKVIFAPGAFFHAINVLMASFDGKNIEKGVSPFKDRLREKIFDERFTMQDDGLLSGSLASAPFDDEGTPTQTTPLVEKGVLKNFIADRRTANKIGLPATGNGFKMGAGFGLEPDVESQPSITPTTISVAGGTSDSKKIFASLDEGVFVNDLIGTMMGNPLTGMLAGNIALGFLVKGGQVQGRIKDAMISVNLFDALKSSIIELSKDVHVSGWRSNQRLPYILLDGCTIATPE